MQHSHTLTRHRDIQAWVSDRQGLPAVSRVAKGRVLTSPKSAVEKLRRLLT